MEPPWPSLSSSKLSQPPSSRSSRLLQNSGLKQNRTVKFHPSLSRQSFYRAHSWIPAFAGMTNMKGFFKFTHWVTLFVGCIESKTKHCQFFVSFFRKIQLPFLGSSLGGGGKKVTSFLQDLKKILRTVCYSLVVSSRFLWRKTYGKNPFG